MITEEIHLDTGDEIDTSIFVTVQSKEDLIMLQKAVYHGNTYGIDGDNNLYKRIIGG